MTPPAQERLKGSSEARENWLDATSMKLAENTQDFAINFFAMAPQLNAEKSKELTASLLKIKVNPKTKESTTELDVLWLPEINQIATAIEGYEQERPESAKGKGGTLEVTLAQRRAKQLRTIEKMLESVKDDRDTKHGGFNLSNLATAAGTELMQIESTIDSLKLKAWDQGHPLNASLRRERAYLQRLLTRCRVPSDPRSIMAMREASGFGPPPGSEEEKIKHDVTQSLRVLGCFAFGGMAILTGLMGYFSNKENPNLKPMFVYLGLLGLSVAGKKPFLGTKEEAARDRIAFLGTPEYVNIASPYGQGLVPMMKRLFAQRGDALKNVRKLLPYAQKPMEWKEFTARMCKRQAAEGKNKNPPPGNATDRDAVPESKREEAAFAAWKELRAPIASGGEILKYRMTPDLLLQNDYRFIQFLNLTLEKAQNGEIDEAILRTLRDGKEILPEPPTRYKQLLENKNTVAG